MARAPAFEGDIGSAGFNGFSVAFANNFGAKAEIKFVNGGHSAALDSTHVQSITEFIIHGTINDD